MDLEGNYQKYVSLLVKNSNLTNQLNDNYFSRNFLLRYIFWKRVKIVLDITKKMSDHRQVLDFGTGWGVLLPALSKTFNNVYAIDIDKRSLDLADQIRQFSNCKNICLQQVSPNKELAVFANNSFSCIISTDVLEHVPSYLDILTAFNNLLTSEGRLIVSVPTENLTYRIAKKIMNHPETNDNHVCDPKYIEAALREKFAIITCHNLYFFKIFNCKKKINQI
jgi:2-polyprenyl-3-methyl-5-hydroxy-6-metoxy-1,4-benzoquinol methylase